MNKSILNRSSASTLAILFAALGLNACMTTPAADDPVMLQLNEQDARLARIERVLDNQSLLKLLQQVEALEEESRAVRGEQERMQHDMESSAERQRELYLDVDQRLQKIEGGGASSGRTASSTAGADLPVPGGSELANYQASLELLKEGRYPEARTGFEQFLRAYPDSNRADNAQYWKAETFYVNREFSAALPEFEKVLEQFPRSSKIPDALLKVGFCNYELERYADAKVALHRVTNDFPDKTAARLAEQRIEQMQREGR